MSDTTINPGAQLHEEGDVYRTTSRAAIVSLTMAILGLSAFMMEWLAIIPLIGLFIGVVALNSIKKYPDELLGRPYALAGVVMCAILIIAAPAYHIYEYATEVPEGYTRVSFFSLMANKGQQDVPTPDSLQWNGQQVFIKGYVHPSSMSSIQAKKFVLVPDLGTCCFGGQPPLTHMIEVSLTGDEYARKDMRKKRLAGKFTVNSYLKPIDGLQGVYYQLRADILK
ncbi:MAG: DUF4190 domain-containing protein [Pirellulales bacterium]